MAKVLQSNRTEFEPIQPSMQRKIERLSQGYSGWGVKLTTHLHLGKN